MKIVVGSTNPVKISATEGAFKKIFPNEKISVVGVKVSSGVSDMPLSPEETLQGATNRAKNALQKDYEANFGVGIEGGLECHPRTGWFLRAWVALLEKETGRLLIGSTFGMWLPDPLIHYMKEKNVDLAAAIDLILKIKEVGRTTGVYGLLTKSLVDRKSAFIDAIISAAWPLINPKLESELTRRSLNE